MRAEALKWWFSLDHKSRTDKFEEWKLITSDRRKEWALALFSASDSCIERLYRELVLDKDSTKQSENTNNETI